jgi:hypothetical protein
MGGRLESVTSPLPPGSGRIRDLVYPDYNTAGAAVTSAGMRARITGAPLLGQINNLGSLVTTQFLAFQGVECTTQNNTGAAGAGGSISFLNIANVHIRTTKPANWPLDDDWNVHRIVWIASMSQLPTSNNDTGLQLVNSAVQSAGIIRTPALGFGWQYTNAGLSFIANNGGGPVQTVLATNGVGGYQSSDFHSMEMRIFQAMPTADAFLKLVLDDVVIATISWAGGTLPAPAGAAALAFFPTIWNNSTGGGAVCTHYLGVQSAPTELATF